MKKRSLASVLFALLLMIGLAAPLRSAPFVAPSTFTNLTDGTIVYAQQWNNSIGDLYTYITSTLLPQLNVVTTAGDIYYYTGSQLARLGIGSTGQVLTVAAGLPSWASGSGLPLTTFGDILGYTGSALARVAGGTNGQVLTYNTGTTTGLSWANPANLNSAPGMIIMYNLTYGGSIPSGWVLCDGTNGTPNMIGMIPIGGQSSSGSSTANPNGYGNTSYGNTYGSTTTSASVTINGTTSSPNSTIDSGTTVGNAAASNSHTHTFSGSGSFSTTNQPATMSLIFIMKS